MGTIDLTGFMPTPGTPSWGNRPLPTAQAPAPQPAAPAPTLAGAAPVAVGMAAPTSASPPMAASPAAVPVPASSPVPAPAQQMAANSLAGRNPATTYGSGYNPALLGAGMPYGNT